jgi:hypothetical protein
VAIEQLGGVTTGPDGSQARIILEGDELLEAGRTYLFFASIGPDGTITSAPFARFAVGSNGSLAALPDWAHLGIAARLAGMSVEGAAAEVQNAAP